MTWTYTPDAPVLPRDDIRDLLFDTDPLDPLLSDEQIARCVARNVGDPNGPVNVYRVAAEGAQIIATNFSRQGSQQDDRVKVDFDQRAADYRLRAVELRQWSRNSGVVPVAGGISISDKETNQQNDDNVQPMFSRDMLTPPGVPTGELPNVDQNVLSILGR